MGKKSNKTIEGPQSYKNWIAYIKGENLINAFEFPLFSDARITGKNTKNFKPYYFLNPVPQECNPGFIQPAIYLRMENYLKPDSPDMSHTNSEHYHGGSLIDEIAALTSLALGIRIKAGSISRYFDGEPHGHPVEWMSKPKPVVLMDNRKIIIPTLLGKHSLNGLNLLSKFPKFSPQDAIILVRVSRLYQDALWIAESDPSLAWLMIVSAVEGAAYHWKQSEDSPLDRLKISKPDLVKLLDDTGIQDLSTKVANHIADSIGCTKKFIDFIINFLPPPPQNRPEKWGQFTWEEGEMKKAMNLIYGYRSKALHVGIPFPAPMCISPCFKESNKKMYLEKPMGSASSTLGGTWKSKDTPMLLSTFEYIARKSLLKWWDSLGK